ncbi:MAG TPA: VTT domain-containing protein [Polyangiaceae bacterium]|nr:VTT domain-containing protein [Polyangiaceae bacterium]
MRTPLTRYLTFAAGAVIVAMLAFFVWSGWDSAALLAWKEDASPPVFFGAMSVLPALGVPVTPLFLLAGTTFGVRVGLLGSITALGLNLAICYWIARGGMRPRIEALVRRFDYELPVFEGKSRRTVRFAVAVKLTPGVPAFVKNYVLGMAGVPFALYFGLSMLITGGYAAALVVMGESLFEHDLRQAFAPVAVLAVLGLIGLGTRWWLKRR